MERGLPPPLPPLPPPPPHGIKQSFMTEATSPVVGAWFWGHRGSFPGFLGWTGAGVGSRGLGWVGGWGLDISTHAQASSRYYINI